MQYGILGPLQVRTSSGEDVAVGGPRPRALLTMLLLQAGRVVSVDALVDGQYGDDLPAGAANAVQAQVSRLRRALPPGTIEFTGGGYRVAADPDDVDALRFARLAADGRRALAEGRASDAAALQRESLGLWRGPALPDLAPGPATTRLDGLRLDAQEDLAEAELALPDGTSVATLEALAAEHPLRERLRGLLMRALHAAGRPAQALEEYEKVRKLLRAELGTDPSPELAEVHTAILRAEHPAPPRPRTAPAQLTSFVGRAAELDRLAALATSRLVTILGPGGMGKTRLAAEYAAGVGCWVELTPLGPTADRDAVATTVLAALGVRDSPTGVTTPLDRLVAALGEQQHLLLVVDNCEQVVAAAAAVAREVLAACPGVRIVATSREPLGLTGETLLPLAPLPDAVRLFADRAAAVRPGFVVDSTNAATVETICAALDGLPLAIELAAARLRQFGVDTLARRLSEHDRFRVLSRGDPTADARHRTLEAVVAWSWDLLNDEEQTLARRFAIFAGGAPAEAVEAVCGVPEDVLDDLVDRSLVETDGERYRMLETVRLFCLARLDDAAERDATAAAHARHHLALAREADPQLRRADQLRWLARLSAEDANLTAALRWSADHDRPTAFALVAALAAYWWLSGRHSRPGPVAAALLRAGDPPDGMDEEYASVVAHAVPRAAPEHWARGEAIMRTRGRELRHPFGAALWGMAAGPPAAGPNPRLIGTDPWSVALDRLSSALLDLLDGRPADAGLAAARDAFDELGERWGGAQALDWLALVASRRGEWARAQELWSEALRLQEELGALDECAEVLCHRATGLLRRGDVDAAAADVAHARELWTSAGRSPLPQEAKLVEAEIAMARGDLPAARAVLAAAGEGAAALTARGRAAEDPEEARRLHRDALDAAPPLAAARADALEGVASTVGPERAAFLLGVAVALRGTAVAGDPHVARVAARARDAVGPDAFSAAWSRGAALPREEALRVSSADCR
ncbi:SARP family transcriptional regulator [Pseudonocardia sulfidoxydans NBRC 16205]|uniref:SARP family transcriptional regulator n=1 Tax=Pseudonocardia sulfidoxydans NBRC 16205 TaxID=1223511 RepID=A0A511D8C2_9PSEU|nr:SARP family transcriptional regulator [Pseudonocardia sulfidoxydans NBRC 16205]